MVHKLTTLPYNDFMAEFLPPIAGEPDGDAYNNMFDTVPTGGKETDLYQPFVDVVNNAGILGNFFLAATDALPDPTDPKRRKTDVAMYHQGAVPATGRRTDWAAIELSVEFKIHPNQDDPFDDKAETGYPSSSIRRRDNLGQILGYAGLVFKYQHVTHHFSVVILGDCARVQRIDHVWLVFSSKFNYKQEPAKLGQFFWRLAHASPETRGRDPTAVHVSPSSPEGLEMLAWKNKTLPADDYTRQLFVRTLEQGWSWWKLQVRDGDGYKEFLVAKPTFIAPGVVGRATRGYVAYDKSNPDHPFVYLKDCWRVVHGRSELEGDILAALNQCGVSNVPTVLCHGDVGAQRTVSQDVWTRLHPTQKCRMKVHQHYRLVVKEVGLPLKEFPNGKELVSVLIDCLEAHEEAYTKANIIHRDISVGNILLVPYGLHPEDQQPIYKGLLTDWELSKRTEYNEFEARHPDRTGTWQFLSANALKRPKAQIEIADELESFFHVLLYCAIRFLPHTCSDVSQFMYSFFDRGEVVGLREYTCSVLKSSVMLRGRLVAPTDQSIVFLLKPRTREEIAAATADAEKIPSLQLSGSSASSSDATAVEEETTVPEDWRHPIDEIFKTLLGWFKARYELMEPPSTSRPSASNSRVSLSDPRAAAKWERNIKNKASEPTVRVIPDVALLKATAKKISTHGEMLYFLTNMLYSEDWQRRWPRNDRQPDQLDPDFNPDNEQSYRPGKRTREDDVTLPVSQSKRICSTASRG
ncbi:hypothetical protein GY45DRAFT_1245751 [Cubamyces sp. BRFM 1775]|nr:hypothetical protein GY45DRAFT_1245751 [Cubamyces sp. BRFM 1775]